MTIPPEPSIPKAEDEAATKNAPGSWASMPQRKPAPTATIAQSEATQEIPHATRTKWTWSSLSSRSRKLLIIGLVAILLVALIIGLAVGLTVGKKKKY